MGLPNWRQCTRLAEIAREASLKPRRAFVSAARNGRKRLDGGIRVAGTLVGHDDCRHTRLEWGPKGWCSPERSIGGARFFRSGARVLLLILFAARCGQWPANFEMQLVWRSGTLHIHGGIGQRPGRSSRNARARSNST